jgi:hypothetical protein
MNAEDRQAMLVALDEELLQGGVILSEWCTFIIQEADLAFISNANLASILTAVAGIETYLKSEYTHLRKERLVTLINGSDIDEGLKQDLHTLRRYRNKWVHVDDPWDDAQLLSATGSADDEIERMAFFAARALRRTIYQNQWV